jgi:hypothetical protein
LDLDCCWRADYFELIVNTLEENFIFRGCWGSSKNWLELKNDPQLSDLPKSVKHSVKKYFPHENIPFAESHT